MKKVLNFIIDNYIIFFVYAFIGWVYEVSWYLIVRHKFVNRGVLFGPYLPIYGFGILILLLILKRFMSKRHETSNIIYTAISIFTIVTFIFTTIVEYTTPKIYSVTYYLSNYGLLLFIVNIICIVLINIYIKKSSNDRVKHIDTTIVLIFLSIWIITTLVEFVAHYFIDVYTNKLLWDYSKDFLNINRRVNWDASRNFAIGGTLLLYLVQPKVNNFLKNSKYKKIVFVLLLIILSLELLLKVI